MFTIAVSCSNGDSKQQSGSLDASGKKKSNLPNSVGASSELLVVMNEGHWKGAPGERVREFFHQNVPGLPQKEPRFHTANINVSALNKKMFKKHRNLFVVEIDNSFEETNVSNKSDVWASPQRYVRIAAPSEEAFYKAFEKYKEGMMILFHKSEIRRIQITFEAGEDITLKNNLMKTRGISLVMPRGFFIAKEKDNFLWIRKETQDYSQGLLVMFNKYKSSSQFDRKAIISRRNNITRKHIPGPSPGSYMKISTEVDPLMEETTFMDSYAVLTRGLWDVANDFMGGPFMSYTFVDEKNARLIT
ncbi:MAG: DUF4837 family protein [Bacteroidales bacterium]|nr:DUF4837 family protein [Bacteroidales bacterium]